MSHPVPTMRPVVYLATPVRADTETERRWNYLRAVTLARLAAAEGLAPVVPLLTVAGALEGFPLLAEDVSPAPMECCLSILRAVYTSGGDLWMLERDGSGLSIGCAYEREAWRRWLNLEGGTRHQVPVRVAWSDLGLRMEIAGLELAWRALRGSPDPDQLRAAEGILNAGSDQHPS